MTKLRRDERRFLLLLCAWLVAFAVSCGSGSLTGPTPIPSVPPVVHRPAMLPLPMYGMFVASRDVGDAAPNGGNVVLLVPTYADDAEQVALTFQANRKIAIVSAHHVFGNQKSQWAEGWAHTKRWMQPLTDRDLVAAIYVVDEPLANGITPETRDEAIAIVRAEGYRTVVAEWVDSALKNPRPPVDYYGVTCYDFPAAGGWSLNRCISYYGDRPEWDLVIGQGFDLLERNGPVDEQIARWAALGRKRAGVIFWVWRWPGQVGIGDNPELLAAYRAP